MADVDGGWGVMAYFFEMGVGAKGGWGVGVVVVGGGGATLFTNYGQNSGNNYAYIDLAVNCRIFLLFYLFLNPCLCSLTRSSSFPIIFLSMAFQITANFVLCF